MSEPKPFASLSSGLLARKGAARPAMRPQGFGQGGAGLEDLGWNDMGFEAPKPAPTPRDGEHDAFGQEIVEHPRSLHPSGLTPVESPVHGQQAEIADRFGGAEETDDADEDEVEETSVEENSYGDDVDEDYDETAELYEPEQPVADEEPEEAEELELYETVEPARLVAFKKSPVVFPELPDAPVAEAPLVEHEVEVVEQPVVELAPEAPVAVVASAPLRTIKSRSAPGLKDKAAFTLRLDQLRHLKLRLACAVNGRSAQMIVTDALDQLLAEMPELEAMAENAKRKGS